MDKNKIKCIVTGGSGFIGTNIMQDLINLGYDILNFDISEPKNINHKKYWKNISLLDDKALTEAFSNFQPTHILHLASVLGGDNITSEKLEENIYGMKNLMRAIKNTNTVKNFIFTSSLLVCENGYIPKNNTDFCAPNAYGQSKVECEKIIRSENLNCDWLIVRPTAIWGPWFQESSKRFFEMIDKNLYFHLGNNNNNKTACFVGNASYMIIELLFSNKIMDSKVFYLADYPAYSIRSWGNSIQKSLRVRPIISIPLFMLKFIAKFGDAIKYLLKYDFPLTTFRLNNMQVDAEYPIDNTRKICEKLPYDLDKSVYITLQWMYKQNMIHNKPTQL